MANVKVKLPSRPESSIGRSFVKLMKKQHPTWLVWKLSSPGRRDVPDYAILTDEGKIHFLEMKQGAKKPTERQDKLLRKLCEMGFNAGWSNDARLAAEGFGR